MDAQQVFYVIASIVLVLFGLAILAFFFLSFAIFRLINTGKNFINNSRHRVDEIVEEFSHYLRSKSTGWGVAAAAKVLVGLFTKIIFGRR